MIYIKFQNCCFFFFEVYFEWGASKLYANQFKDVSNGVHHFYKIGSGGSTLLPKLFFSTSILQDFCLDLFCNL